jgi:hypothetical protein
LKRAHTSRTQQRDFTKLWWIVGKFPSFEQKMDSREEKNGNHSLVIVAPKPCFLISTTPISIGSMPQELLHLIFDYTVSSSQDLIRCGCVCQGWRLAMLGSPSWIRLMSRTGRRNLQHPREISGMIIQQISEWIQQQNRIRCRQSMIRVQPMLVNVGDILIAIAGAMFGINWNIFDQKLFLLMGFFLLYTILMLCVVIGSVRGITFDDHQVLMIIVISLLTMTVALTQLKLMFLSSSPSLLWVEVISPLYLLFIFFSSILLNFFLDLSWSFICPFILWLIATVPPLLTLTLFCYFLDYPHAPLFHSFHPHQLIYLLSLHLCGLVGYFGLTLMSQLSHLSHHQRGTNIISVQSPLLHVVLAATGLISTVLLFVQSTPSLMIPFLSNYFNLIFYLVLIVESFALTFPV